jgi:glucosylceramidase
MIGLPSAFFRLKAGLGTALAALCYRLLSKRSPVTPAAKNFMKPALPLRSLATLLALLPLAIHAAQKPATVWLTKHDRSSLFAAQAAPLPFTASSPAAQTIEVNDRQKYQTMDGFGFALTGGSAQHLVRMHPPLRAALLRELFAVGSTNVGISYLRLSIGASDLNERVFTYDDLQDGETDPSMARFSLDPDRADVIPVLKEILAINPKIKILGSPWTAPIWMKTNRAYKGGRLKPECYDAYARYFVKYLEGMKAEGIRVDAITVQNEPLNGKNTPSLEMSAEEQARFIKQHLGPALAAAKLDTKIVLYDHNCDVPEYPLSILRDPLAAKYVDGTGFHHYGGKIETMSTVHDAFPKKHLYFTEQMVTERNSARNIDIASQVARLIVNAPRNWSRNVILWNLAADQNNDPHTNDGGCGICQGAITINGNLVTRNLAYFVVAHAAKFVRPGSVRIASNSLEPLPNVAFKTPDGTTLIVANRSQSAQTFNVRFHNKAFSTTLDSGAVGTYVW